MRVFIIIAVLGCQSVYGQTWSEWFRQKKTQQKYLLKQIAALKIFGGYVSKGYAITQGGLKAIGGLKNGCFEQDSTFMRSLRIVSPKVKSYKKVADIITICVRVSTSINKTMQDANTSAALNAAEKRYLRRVFDKIAEACAADLDQLMNVITDTKFEMSDDERIRLIDQVYLSVVDKQSFVQSFKGSFHALIMQRRQQAEEINRSKILNGIR